MIKSFIIFGILIRSFDFRNSVVPFKGIDVITNIIRIHFTFEISTFHKS